MTGSSPAALGFGKRLRAAMDDRGPLCAGIDPHPGLLEAWGLTDSVDGLEKFALSAAEALAPVVAAVKPQSAFFERFGSRGIAVLERVVEISQEAGALVVLDVKRGDIGSTAQAYADAYLDPASPMAVDAITATPFLGFGSLDPMLTTADEHGKGVFVLALTSNPEAPPFQHARTDAGRTVAGTVLDELRARNGDVAPMGSFGAVVGATIAETGERPRHQRPAAGARDRCPGRHRRRRTPYLRRSAPPRPAVQLARDPGRRTRPRSAEVGRRALAGCVRRAPGRQLMRRLAAVVAAVMLFSLTGCGDPMEDYCSQLREDRKEFAEMLESSSSSALIGNLPMLRELAEKSPDDLSDEWQIFLDAIEDLDQAIERAGVKPSDFDDGKAAGRTQRWREEGDRRGGRPDHHGRGHHGCYRDRAAGARRLQGQPRPVTGD